MNIIEELIKLKTEDNVNIALWKVYKTNNTSKNIFFTHGTFSDKSIMMGIAKYFVNLGYTCWIMEWRNHGSSDFITKKFNFETIALLDIKTSFNYLKNKLQLKNISCITHSGGGIVLTMFLIKNKNYINFINNITFFACQAFGAGQSNYNYFKILLSKYFTLIIGYIPSKFIGKHKETYYTMKQWFNWNLNNNFIGNNNFDYLKNMKQITIPILSICAKNDTFIAPKQGCIKYINAFNNLNNKLIFCSKKNGFIEDYNHSRIILSKNASKEIWPIVYSYLK